MKWKNWSIVDNISHIKTYSNEMDQMRSRFFACYSDSDCYWHRRLMHATIQLIAHARMKMPSNSISIETWKQFKCETWFLLLGKLVYAHMCTNIVMIFRFYVHLLLLRRIVRDTQTKSNWMNRNLIKDKRQLTYYLLVSKARTP